jgi:hypothetical protein
MEKVLNQPQYKAKIDVWEKWRNLTTPQTCTQLGEGPGTGQRS